MSGAGCRPKDERFGADFALARKCGTGGRVGVEMCCSFVLVGIGALMRALHSWDERAGVVELVGWKYSQAVGAEILRRGLVAPRKFCTGESDAAISRTAARYCSPSALR